MKFLMKKMVSLPKFSEIWPFVVVSVNSIVVEDNYLLFFFMILVLSIHLTLNLLDILDKL